MVAKENTAYMESSAPPCQVDELITALRAIRRHPKGYRGIRLHFSRLDRAHRQPRHRRAIARAFSRLVQEHGGQLFWTSHFDMVFICPNCSKADLDIAIVAARRAVEDSPLIKEYSAAGQDHELCDWYDLGQDMANFMAMAQSLKTTPDQESPDTQITDVAADDKTPVQAVDFANSGNSAGNSGDSGHNRPAPPMGPLELDQLEKSLQHQDVLSMMAKQTVYVIAGNARPQAIFVEHYISVLEIQRNLLPNYTIAGDRWLFQRLCRTLDRKLLATLPKKGIPPTQVISFNIMVETVFTPEFDQFIPVLKQRNNQPLILEMDLFDAINNIQQFYEARNKIAQLGCRISLDIRDIQSLAVFDREFLTVDFLKIHWQPAYTNLLAGRAGEKIMTAIEAQGKMRLILCHCDSQAALDFGEKAGIHMYQGFLIDSSLRN